MLKALAATLLKLAPLRDGLLVLGGTAYIAGYAAWSFYAWGVGVGPVPAFESQYFLSGCLLMLMASVPVGATWSIYSFIPRSVERLPARAFRVVRAGVVGALATCGGLIVASLFTPNASFGRGVTYVSIASLVLLDAFLRGAAKRTGRAPAWWTGRPLLPVLWTLVVFVACVSGLEAFVQLYASIPQALGGAKPRVAKLLLKPEHFSDAMLFGMAGGPSDLQRRLGLRPTDAAWDAAMKNFIAETRSKKVVESVSLDVFWKNGDSVVLGGGPGPAAELPRHTFEAILWEDDPHGWPAWR